MKRCGFILVTGLLLSACGLLEEGPRTAEDEVAACKYYENQVAMLRPGDRTHKGLPHYWTRQLELCYQRGYRGSLNVAAY